MIASACNCSVIACTSRPRVAAVASTASGASPTPLPSVVRTRPWSRNASSVAGKTRDRIRTNQRFDVQDIGVRGVLGSRAGPKRPLDARATSLEGRKRPRRRTAHGIGGRRLWRLRCQSSRATRQGVRRTDLLEQAIGDDMSRLTNSRCDRGDSMRLGMAIDASKVGSPRPRSVQGRTSA